MMAQPVNDSTSDGGQLYEAADTDELDPGDFEDAAEEESPKVDGVALRPNTLIPERGITGFRNRSRAQTVVLVGEQKTGKTTLLAALYGLFCKGPIGDFEFVSSQTLYSFAERNHLAMLSPDRAAPATPRTSIAESVSYFHLKVRQGEVVSEMIISDRSGETFEAARVDTSLMDRLTELALADRICFLLDASRLTKIETRAAYRRIFRQTMRALIDNDVIPKTAKIEVLVTKIDRVSREKDGRDLLAEVTEYEEELIKEFGSKGLAFQIHRICALPRANVKLGFLGMNELVGRWALTPADSDISPQPVGDALRHIDRLPIVWS
ncbi:TRAFAC clade GTPase domain-containing protein [Rhizobium leguminosarum]|uniref:TRAFAC clade GTPase domain-containing protein n=1 Tax=Rhizobium leguminosarum TaxID=384 RepID=UPI001FED6960|nr:hypothetical protein [Rhizobium leguminosarum]